ncbi:MAG: DUF2267 domain-containing protein [Candidatus Promineifilaceae bacterium]|nr:DUF2267 domain-containing protein [Candidatus Promineifilaceae bacterium]
MQYDEFITRVQEEAELDDREEAETITEATLETLSERLTRMERRNVIAELPDELKEFLWKREETTRFLLDEFYNRVAARADLRAPEAVRRSQAVMTVLMEAISPGQINAVMNELPEEYQEIFTGIPYGPGSPSAE